MLVGLWPMFMKTIRIGGKGMKVVEEIIKRSRRRRERHLEFVENVSAKLGSTRPCRTLIDLLQLYVESRRICSSVSVAEMPCSDWQRYQPKALHVTLQQNR